MVWVICRDRDVRLRSMRSRSWPKPWRTRGDRSAASQLQTRDTRHGARRQLDERFATASATDSAASADTLLRKGGLGTGICSPLR